MLDLKLRLKTLRKQNPCQPYAVVLAVGVAALSFRLALKVGAIELLSGLAAVGGMYRCKKEAE